MTEQKVTNLHDARIPTDGSEDQIINDFSIIRDHVHVHFRDLDQRLIRYIDEADVVIGCVAWLTSPAILSALSYKRWVSIIVQKEDFLRPDVNDNKERIRRLYASLPSADRNMLRLLSKMSFGGNLSLDAVRCVGVRQESKKRACPRMHHKFVVFCQSRSDVEPIEPYAVWTGSFNFTYNASLSFENAIYIENADIACAYLNEWEQVTALSEPLDWKSEWVDPEWRIGS